ncbi:regulator of hemoglobinization and erythroid cell expansion protein [Rhynchocyon petersi]
MKIWHGLVIALVSLVLQSCFFAAVNYLISRHMANVSRQTLKAATAPDPGPTPAHQHPTSVEAIKTTPAERIIPVSDFRYRHGSDTSSDSSDSSDSSPSRCQGPKDINYTQVVFAASGGRKKESALDYENMKEATDYVNVNPKSHKSNFWTFADHASESVEYTQV